MVEGYFDCRAGAPGGHPERRRLVRHGADAGAGAAAETFAVEGRPQLRSRRGRPGGGGTIVGAARGGGFQVNVAMLPAGDDPDNYIRKHGGAAYQEQLRQFAAVPGISARSVAPRTTICQRMRTAGRSWTDAGGGGADSGRGRSVTSLRTGCRKGADNGRGGPGGNPQGGGPATDRRRRSRAAGARPGAGQDGGAGPDLGAPAGPARPAWRRWRSWKPAISDGLATPAILRQARSLQEWPAGDLTGGAARASK